jgi:hypothetical protein
MTTSPFAWAGRLWRTHLGLAALAYALFFAAAAFEPAGSPLWGMAATSAYSVASPALLVFAQRFWRSLAASVACWIGLMVAAVRTSEAFVGHPLREDATVFMLPFMIFPAALLVAAVVWLLVRRRRRDAPPPSPT